MAQRPSATNGDGLTPEKRERLEWIVVQLLEIAAKLEDNAPIKIELMQLANQLVELMEE
jgi:predicted YcjX-like family ATPase